MGEALHPACRRALLFTLLGCQDDQDKGQCRRDPLEDPLLLLRGLQLC